MNTAWPQLFGTRTPGTGAEALSALEVVTCQQQYSQNWTGCRHFICSSCAACEYLCSLLCMLQLVITCMRQQEQPACIQALLSSIQAANKLPVQNGASTVHLGCTRGSMHCRCDCSTITGCLTCCI